MLLKILQLRQQVFEKYLK